MFLKMFLGFYADLVLPASYHDCEVGIYLAPYLNRDTEAPR